jgi:hypothetical protein
MMAVARISILLSFALAAGNWAVRAQDAEEIRYQEDYDRLQEILKISDPAKKADQLVVYYKGRPKLDSRIRVFADSNFGNTLNSMLKQPDVIKKLVLGALAVRPNFGEALFFYGVILKNEGKLEEAAVAFAKSSLIENSRQPQAKQLLDPTYRAAHKGSIVGEDKWLNKIKAELK